MRRVACLALSPLVLACAVGLAGCVAPGPGPETTPAAGATPVPGTTIEAGPEFGPDMGQLGPFVIRYSDAELRLRPSTYCSSGICVDGFDENPPSVGAADELLVSFSGTAYDELHVAMLSGDDFCTARWLNAEVTDAGDGWWRVRPIGPAGEYQAGLFVGGGSAGDAHAVVRWTVAEDLPLPPVTASLTVIADHDGRPDSYGVELGVANLKTTPGDASATITVTAANGASHTFAAERTMCAGEGALTFTAPAAEGLTAAALGDFPFAYRVDLTIDGEQHVGTGTYPDDATPRELDVPLTLDPAVR